MKSKSRRYLLTYSTHVIACLLLLLNTTIVLQTQTQTHAQAQPSGSWDDRFGLPLTDGEVFTVIETSGAIFAGGSFTRIGGTAANNLARYDGRAWVPFGEPNAPVRTIKIIDQLVYVGGDFSFIGGITASRVAVWDGSQWHPLGAGIRGAESKVNALEYLEGDLIVAGRFTNAGDVQTFNIARWNGTTWRQMWFGLGGAEEEVHALAVVGQKLFAGGRFFRATTLQLNHLAQWTGFTWEPVQTGVTGLEGDLPPDQVSTRILSLLPSGNDLIVGGSFTAASGVAATNVARWTGAAWLPIGSGVDLVVSALAANGTDLYAGGTAGPYQAPSGNQPAYWGGRAGPMRWNGEAWEEIGGGVHGTAVFDRVRIHDLLSADGKLYVAGNFARAGEFIAQGLVAWDGQLWNGLGNENFQGIYGAVSKILALGTNVFALGDFTRAGSTDAQSIARWDGARWHAFAVVEGGSVLDFAAQKTDLIVAGTFTGISGVSAKSVARWDGSTWTALGNGISGSVAAVTATDRYVYVGGKLNIPGAQEVIGAAKWDGQTWQILSGGLTENSHSVSSIIARGEELYLAGRFSFNSTTRRSLIASWNGSEWAPVGEGLWLYFDPSTTSDCSALISVTSLGFWRGDLIAAGSFDRSGEKPLNNIARWNGSTWSSIGEGVGRVGSGCLGGSYFPLYAMVATEDAIVVGGMTFEGTPLLAQWTGDAWVTLQPSLANHTPDFPKTPLPIPPPPGRRNSSVYALSSSGTNLYVGGNFSTADGRPSVGFAIWHDATPPRLRVQMAGNQLKVSWPDWAAQYVLESTSALGSAPWQRIDQTKEQRDGRIEVLLAPPVSARFFRLKFE
ncbi:MAG: hypothetical protein AB1813_13190 [Verrucomicrobiota bacterium]